MEFKVEKVLDLKNFILNSKSIICFSLDFEGNVLYCNEGYKRILGYSEVNIKNNLINPLFQSLIIDSKDILLFNGIITFKRAHLNSSYVCQIYKLNSELFFLCEYDGLEVETLLKEMSYNTLSINNMNRELIKKEIMLKNAIIKENLIMVEALNNANMLLKDKVRERTKELEAKNKELEKISNDKSRILGIVAHDLRSPIGGIFSLSEYINTTMKEINLGKQVELPELDECLEFIEVITDSSKHLLELINDIIDVSAIETGKLTINLERINYISFLNKTIGIDKELAKNKNITILMSLEIEDNLAICVDKIKISQVINNFLENAIKFSYPLGKITLKVEDEGEYITTKVIDEGEGIPKSQRDRLFKIFSKTSIVPTGGERSNGLGLYISQNIIEAHNGIIGFEENVDRGSIFYFKLKKDLGM